MFFEPKHFSPNMILQVTSSIYVFIAEKEMGYTNSWRLLLSFLFLCIKLRHFFEKAKLQKAKILVEIVLSLLKKCSELW